MTGHMQTTRHRWVCWSGYPDSIPENYESSLNRARAIARSARSRARVSVPKIMKDI